MDFGNLDLLLLQALDTVRQGIGDVEAVAFATPVAAAWFGVLNGSLRLTNGDDQLFGLGDQVLLFGSNKTDLIVQCLGQSRKELDVWVYWLARCGPYHVTMPYACVPFGEFAGDMSVAWISIVLID